MAEGGGADRNAYTAAMAFMWPVSLYVDYRLQALVAGLILLFTAACAERRGPDDPRTAPGAPGGGAAKSAVTATRQMVVAANPLATTTGLEILRAGGNAVDAAVATQMVLGLVEPQSSGIGGGGFLVYYDAATADVLAYDGRETAPAAARRDMFLKPDGTPMAFYDAVVGGLSVGTPGTLRLLERVHREHGRLPWARLFEPAIRLAEVGFPVSPRLHALLAEEEHLRRSPVAAAYFYPDGAPLEVDRRRTNAAYAATLRAVAGGGADAFYRGSVAGDIVATVRSAPRAGGLSAADLAGYRAKERVPVCLVYRIWRVCGMPPPSSGGIAVLQILGLLEPFDIAALEPGSVEAVHLIAQASRLAFADRGRYLADADFVPVPQEALLADAYLWDRSQLIRLERDMGEAAPGDLPQQASWATPPRQVEPISTSHVSIIDADGNAVSYTTTIESGFGSRLMVRGFLLNNELTDFAFQPVRDGRPVANRVEPGKRPRSSMAPTLVFDADGRLVLVVGSPGGSTIIPYVVKTLVAILDWGLDPQTAVDLPNFANRNGATELEKGTTLEAIAPALAAMGHEVKIVDMTSGLHAIEVTSRGLVGGADSRREGVAAGD